MKLLSISLLAAASLAIGIPRAFAQEASAPGAASTSKSAEKKASSSKKKAEVDEDDKAPDISASSSTEYSCELGRKVTVYRHADDDQHIALRWKKQLLRLQRVETTTGAHRFENRKNGWVWIDIPTKGMLLDAKKGQQLANECRSPEQLKSLNLETPST